MHPPSLFSIDFWPESVCSNFFFRRADCFCQRVNYTPFRAFFQSFRYFPEMLRFSSLFQFFRIGGVFFEGGFFLSSTFILC